MNSPRPLHAIIASAIILLSAGACQEPQTPAQKADIELNVPHASSDYHSGQQFVRVVSDLAWAVSIDFGDEEAWATVTPSSGSGSTNSVVFAWTENAGGSTRSCTLTLRDVEGDEFAATFTQTSKPGSGIGDGGDGGGDGGKYSDVHPDAVPAWMELPAITDGEELFYFNHSMTLSGGTKTRNYSFLFDVESKLAHWVAYPLNDRLIGSGSRTNEWAYDPKVPAKYQPVLYSSYSGSYDRGHQLPSADRLTRNANEATFYFTNMTPQYSRLNQVAWATLETWVRDWASQMDTLYVVTGADVSGNCSTCYDGEGNIVTVPNGYFKALLGVNTRNSSIGNSTGGWIGIGFYFEHEYYDNKRIMSQSMTIDALEAKLGYDFFPNLVSRVGESVAATVESTKDSWWSNN